MVKAALEKNPNDTTLMTKYANFLFNSGKFSEAVSWFEKVVALQPDSADAKTDLGTALWNSGVVDSLGIRDERIELASLRSRRGSWRDGAGLSFSAVVPRSNDFA